jgi:hypothetical protein
MTADCSTSSYKPKSITIACGDASNIVETLGPNSTQKVALGCPLRQ